MSTRRILFPAALVVAAPLVIALLVTLTVISTGALNGPALAYQTACSTASVRAGTSVGGVTLDSGQISDARIIYDTAQSLHLPQQAAVIAIATAMQESSLHNLPYGDRDSLGLFQQRPSQGWGSPEQIMNPVYAATAFYKSLITVPGWQNLPLTLAAQDVQHSGYPGAYAQWQPLASALASTFSRTAGNCADRGGRGSHSSGTVRIPARYSLGPRVPPQVRFAILYAFAQLGKPYRWGGTGPAEFDCSGLVMMAYRAAGISLPRTTFQQVDAGAMVKDLVHAQAGDLLFTPGSDGTASSPGHVGMYLGDGLVIDAPGTGELVMITPLAPYWQQNTVAIRRVVT